MPFQRAGSPKLAFVAGYPKSGNTWIRTTCAAWAMGRTGDLQKFVEYDDIGTFEYQSVSPIPVNTLGLDAEALLRPAAMLVLSRKIDSVTLVKTHHACMEVNDMPLFHPEWTRCVVNVIRDPRDVACSAADFFGMSLEEAIEFMDYGQANIGGQGKLHHMLGTWSDHVGSWWRTDRVPVHNVRYEDLLEDPTVEFKSILEFLGAEEHLEDGEEIGGDRLEMAVEGTSFENMQKIEEEHGFPEKSQHQERFFRKGTHGGWREDLSDDQVRTLEEDHGLLMEKLGYDLEYL